MRQFYVVSLAEFILRLEFAKMATLATATISLIILKGTVAHALHFLISTPNRACSSSKNQKISGGYSFEEAENSYEVLEKLP